MNKLQPNVKNLSAAMIFIATIMMSSEVLAAPATLNGVEIASSNNRGYEIVLNTENTPKIQKTATSDTLVLDLKNTKVTKNTNTVYKNADGIEHIILKPEANNLQIEINGKSAGHSNVSIKNELASATQNYNDTVFINKPLDAYAPIHPEEISTEKASFLSTLVAIKNSPTLREILNSSNLGWMVCFVLMFGFILWTNRKNQPRSQVNVKINNNTEVDEENKILKAALDRREGLLGKEGIGQRRTITPKTPTAIPAAQTAYGLKAYNNLPANTSTGSFKVQSNRPLPTELPNRPIEARKPLRAASTATTQELTENLKKTEIQIDNVKFLESMARIYEKSGRIDLANGLTNNIKKAKNLK